jgi:hypothetical protein
MKFLKRYPLAIVAFVLHSLLVGMIYSVVAMSTDGEAGMLWILVEFLDWPCAMLAFRIFPGADNTGIAVYFFLLGGTQWILVGMVLHFLWRRIRWLDQT